MRRDIIIADDFYADPRAVVRHAYSLEYISPYDGAAADDAVRWRTSRWRPASACPFKSSAALIERFEFLTGEMVDREHWNREFPLDERGHLSPGYERVSRGCWWNCSFHVKHHSQVLGELVHNHTDRDIWNSVGEDGWVGLIYLNEDAPTSAGLHTWRNVDPARQYDWMTPKENWIHIDAFGNVFNRLLLHRGCAPHSGAGGWGVRLEEGRLYQTFFFRTIGVREVESLGIDDIRL